MSDTHLSCKYLNSSPFLHVAHHALETQESSASYLSAPPMGRVEGDKPQSRNDEHSNLFQRLLQHTGIDIEQLKQALDYQTLYKIAERQGYEWEGCALKLGLRQLEIDDIKIDRPHRVQEQKYEALKKWKQRRSFRATYEELIKVLIECDRLDIAEYICNLLKTNTQEMSTSLPQS